MARKFKNQMWGSQFVAGPAEIIEKINASSTRYEGSLAHATMLAQTRIISQSDYEKIVHSLKLIRQELENSTFVFS